MRILVAGRSGQVGTSLAEMAGSEADLEIVAIGRPELDIERAASAGAMIDAVKPDVVVNGAAYTAVDRAETDEGRAFSLNAAGAASLAGAARAAGVPIIHLSTDYVFDGTKDAAYSEGDATGPRSAYGRSKLAGEAAVALANPRHAILRTAWLYSPFGANFVRTMLRLAAERDEIRVVDDQWGCPTYAPDLAVAVVAVARGLLAAPDDQTFSGVFHLVAPGPATWCGFAREIMDASRRLGGPSARVVAIATRDYPTAAERPANSRLDCAKIRSVYGVALPPRAESLARCLRRLVA